jgi:hypothetical protein
MIISSNSSNDYQIFKPELPFPVSSEKQRYMLRFFSVKDIAMFALTCKAANTLVEQEAKIRLLDVLNFLKKVNLKNQINPDSFKYRVISFLEEAKQNLSSSFPKALRYCSQFFAIYPLIKEELAKAI